MARHIKKTWGAMAGSGAISKEELRWPFAGGSMAEQIRRYDWTSTRLGPLDTWPDSLRSAVDLMLGCAFPATLQWGRDLVLFYNDAYIPLIGSRHPIALGKPIMETFPEIEHIYGPMVARIWSGEHILLKDQLYRYAVHEAVEDSWYDLSYSPVYDTEGEVAGILAIGLDTTSKVLAEKARSSADDRLRRVLETDAVGVIFFDHTGTVVDANDVFLNLVGYTRAEIAQGTITWRTLTPPEWVKVSEEQMEKLAKTGRIGPYEKEYFLRDGSRRNMLFAGRDLGDGTIAEYAIDITARKTAEASSRAMEQRFRALVEASSDIVYRMSPDWTEMLELRGVHFLADTDAGDKGWLEKYIYPDDREQVWNAVQEAIGTQSVFELEHRVLQEDGSLGWIFSRAVPLRDPDGRIIEWFGAATNVTARKRAESTLMRTEKLATLGRLAASIAHEINNPLEATTNLIYLAQNADGLPEDSKMLLDAASAELQRVAHIARQSLGFYRESSVPAEVSVTALLDATIDLLRGKILMKDVRIDRRWDGEVKIRAVAGELRQIFSNLLANSLDALDNGGEIIIRVTRVASASCPRVRVMVADKGRGIPADVQSKIFEPFFSTKGDHGTGLGLWVTKQLVDKHRGSIRMRSRSEPPVTGTAFSVTLPVDLRVSP